MHILLLLLPVLMQSLNLQSGPLVQYVRFSCDAELFLEEVQNAVVVREGQPLRAGDIRQSLQNLWLLNHFSEIEALQDPFLDGVMITFALKRDWLIRKIKIQRDTSWKHRLTYLGMSLPKSELLQETRLYPMERLNEEGIESVKTRLLHFLRQNGFPDATVKFRSKRDSARRLVDLIIEIDEGTPYTITAITFNGVTRLRAEALRRAMQSKTGGPFAQTRLNKDRDRLADLYRFYGYNINSIPEPLVTLDHGRRTASITFQLSIPPPDRILLEYPHHSWNWDWRTYRLDPSRLGDVLGFGEGELDEETLESYKSALRDQYLAHGYPQAGVEVLKDTDPDERRVLRFKVSEGPRVKVKELTIEGNHGLTREAILKQMLSVPGHLYSAEEFARDQEAILTLYRSRGFPHAQIEEKRTEIDAHQAYLSLRVKEGPAYKIAEVEIAGAAALDNRVIAERLQVQPGQPLDHGLLEADTKRIANMLEIRGYHEAAVAAEIVELQEPGQVKIRFQIEEGAYSEFGKVLITGYLHTKRKIITRSNRIDEGEPYSYLRILESQRQIATLGIFRAVRFEPLDWEANAIRRNVLLSVTETNNSFVDVGLGYSTGEGWRAVFDAGTTNLDGYDRALSTALLWSKIEQRIGLRVREPYFANIQMEFSSELFWDFARKPGYGVTKLGGAVSLRKTLSPLFRVLLEYRLENQELDIEEPGVQVDEKDLGSALVCALGPLVMYDSRDDPRNPRRGFLASLRAETAQPYLGSEVRFPKAAGQTSLYLPLPFRSVLALSARAGIARHLPLSESFLAGGIKSVRGYSYESIRPTEQVYNFDTGEWMTLNKPANGMVVLNAELRYPALWGLQGVLFIDAGNTWESVTQMSPVDLKIGAGFGLRFIAPFGPIGFDLAFKAHPEAGEHGSRVEFMIGHAF